MRVGREPDWSEGAWALSKGRGGRGLRKAELGVSQHRALPLREKRSRTA